jgi:hypothetical protein
MNRNVIHIRSGVKRSQTIISIDTHFTRTTTQQQALLSKFFFTPLFCGFPYLEFSIFIYLIYCLSDECFVSIRL